jgi:putative addiction module CopG family antidote
MPIQLTPEQEERIRAMVDAGTYGSTEEALDAAVSAVESAGVIPDAELEALLLEGLNSGEAVEADDAFWARLREQTDRMVADRRAGVREG